MLILFFDEKIDIPFAVEDRTRTSAALPVAIGNRLPLKIRQNSNNRRDRPLGIRSSDQADFFSSICRSHAPCPLRAGLAVAVAFLSLIDLLTPTSNQNSNSDI